MLGLEVEYPEGKIRLARGGKNFSKKGRYSLFYDCASSQREEPL